MSSKKFLLTATLLSCLMLTACGGGAASSPRAALQKNVDIMETFSSSMETANQPKQVAAALDQYTRELESLSRDYKSLRKNHRDLEQISKTGRFPDDLKEFEQKFAESGMKMMRAMIKVSQFEQDSEVLAAKQRMMDALEKMND